MSDRDLIRVLGEAWKMTFEKEKFWPDAEVLESVIQVDDGDDPPSVQRLYLPHGQYENNYGKVFEPGQKITETEYIDIGGGDVSPVKRELSYKDKIQVFIKRFMANLLYTKNDKALFFIIDNFPEYIEFDPEVKKRYLTYRTMNIGDVLEEQGIANLPASIIINYENGGALGLEETIRVLNSRMRASEQPWYKSPE